MKKEPLIADKIFYAIEHEDYSSERKKIVQMVADDYNQLMIEYEGVISALKAENYAYRMIIAKSNFQPFLLEEGVTI